MNFWANKLSGTQNTAPPKPSRDLFAYTTPAPVPQAVPQQTVYTPSVRMTQGSICPGCGSDNYRERINDRAVACPECGYHPRFQQEGYGVRSLRGEGVHATPARQPANTQTMQGAIAALNAGHGEHITE